MPAQREAEQRALARQTAAADEVAYAEGLRARHKVKVLQPEFQREAAKAVPPTPRRQQVAALADNRRTTGGLSETSGRQFACRGIERRDRVRSKWRGRAHWKRCLKLRAIDFRYAGS